MTQRRPLVAANWKMNGTLASVRSLISGIKSGLAKENGAENTEYVICVPYVYLQEVQSLLQDTDIVIGTQNASEHERGAYTGEISVEMLQDYGCQYVIVGHSERRNIYNESDKIVADKFVRVSESNIVPILCVGEQLQERETGSTEEVIARQLNKVINKAGVASFANAVIAYEPVWAIGTGRTSTPDQAEEVHAFIRLQLARHDDSIADKIRIIYGGSVKADNAKDLFLKVDIDGGLIGGASLLAHDFLTICHSTR